MKGSSLALEEKVSLPFRSEYDRRWHLRPDVAVFNKQQGFQLNAPSLNLLYDGSNNKAMVTFSDVPNGRMIDSNGRMIISAPGVTDSEARFLEGDNNGTAGGDFMFDLFMLTRHATRGRAVNLGDLTALAPNFGRACRVFSRGDVKRPPKGSLTVDFLKRASAGLIVTRDKGRFGSMGRSFRSQDLHRPGQAEPLRSPPAAIGEAARRVKCSSAAESSYPGG